MDEDFDLRIRIKRTVRSQRHIELKRPSIRNATFGDCLHPVVNRNAKPFVDAFEGGGKRELRPRFPCDLNIHRLGLKSSVFYELLIHDEMAYDRHPILHFVLKSHHQSRQPGLALSHFGSVEGGAEDRGDTFFAFGDILHDLHDPLGNVMRADDWLEAGQPRFQLGFRAAGCEQAGSADETVVEVTEAEYVLGLAALWTNQLFAGLSLLEGSGASAPSVLKEMGIGRLAVGAVANVKLVSFGVQQSGQPLEAAEPAGGRSLRHASLETF
jgi:hypothetical protein